MSKFGLSTYEDYIVGAIVNSGFAKNGLMTATTYIITAIVRFHLSILICLFINGTIFTDLIFPILVSIGLSFGSGNLYRYIETHQFQYEKWVDYVIANYSWDNLMMWKRYLMVIILVYASIVLSVVTLDNTYLGIATVQTAIAFIICDLVEHYPSIIRRFKTWKYQPPVSLQHPNRQQARMDARLEEMKEWSTQEVHPSIVELNRPMLIAEHRSIDYPTHQNISTEYPSTIVVPTYRSSIDPITPTTSPIFTRRHPSVLIGSSLSQIQVMDRHISPAPQKPTTPPISTERVPVFPRPSTPPSVRDSSISLAELEGSSEDSENQQFLDALNYDTSDDEINVPIIDRLSRNSIHDSSDEKEKLE